ncbi:putrescine-binding periplasmic protein-related [Striga hermonthica]|uniref:Putrescine-binding periplasmic protein-related n=1 Tax=Striga hermonthica TaxID=68872 RepID=A0A9N7RBR0_STRHE|nr:putrescine-binding periplasmic protein-related [Striga hermonthica]
MQVSPIKLQVFSSSSLPAPIHPDLNPGRFGIRTPLDRPPDLSIKLAATSNSKPCSPAGEFIRHLSLSSVLLVGLGLNSIWACPSAAAARILPASTSSSGHSQESLENVVVEESENFEDEDMKLAFEKWKSKSYALTVPLRVVALQGSFPSVWLRDFLRSQGKRVRFRPEYRRSLGDIFYEIVDPYKKGKINPKSAVAADLVTLGDSWLNFAISKELIEPIQGAEDQVWFQELSDKWKEYLRRSSDGNLDSGGRIYAVPYRWGSMVIAYNKKEFQKHKLAPVEDWSDLWRPELARKISMVDSPREIVGTVLKYMGASYNTTNIESQVFGGKQAVLQQLQKLVQQVRFFDTKDYLKAFKAGQVWVAVGWSSDVLPFAKTLSNVSVIVPKSGASLWADFWDLHMKSTLIIIMDLIL